MNSDSGNLKPYLLCRYAAESNLYTSWLDQLACGYEVVTECPTDFTPPEDCGIVITHEHYRWEEQSCLRRIHEASIVPTLVLADGVLEYRNTWENPTIPDGSMYQPLFADKIACIGNRSARMIESWGNPDKTEVVGLPRLDPIMNSKFEPEVNDADFRLLVCTANTPAFNDEQHATVLESLKALKTTIDSKNEIGGRPLTVVWRLTAGLDDAIGLEKTEVTRSLIDEMKSCDAVITTPSTIMLESMLLKLPTAVLDFSNSPQFVPAAWNIMSESQIDSVLEQLAAPDAAKLEFQRFTLVENLQSHELAAPRMAKLVHEMMNIGHQCRLEKRKLEFPNRILEPSAESCLASDLEFQKFYPNNSTYYQNDLSRIQAELNQALHRLGTAPRELADKNNQISQLQDALDESRRRVADVRARLFKLRKILGIGKENQGES